MKNLKLSAIIILMTSLLFTSCEDDNVCTEGSGTSTTKTLSIPNFTGIDFQEAGDVVISQGPVQEVKATGHPNVIDKLRDNVAGGVWNVDLGNDCFRDYDLTLNIKVPNIEEISLSGAGDIIVNDFVDQGDLSLDISGTGSLSLNSFTGTENLSVNISGSGTITGQKDFSALKNLDIKISGAGKFLGYSIETDECDINLPGAGDCEVFVKVALDVSISGVGNVYYRGDPTITQSISGSGRLINAN